MVRIVPKERIVAPGVNAARLQVADIGSIGVQIETLSPGQLQELMVCIAAQAAAKKTLRQEGCELAAAREVCRHWPTSFAGAFPPPLERNAPGDHEDLRTRNEGFWLLHYEDQAGSRIFAIACKSLSFGITPGITIPSRMKFGVP